MGKRWVIGGTIFLAVAAVAILTTFSFTQQSAIDNLQNQIAHPAQVAGLQTALAQESSEVNALKSQLASVRAQLNAASPTGNLITCADLHQFQLLFQVQGVDTSGGTVVSSEPGNPWLPTHCFKQ